MPKKIWNLASKVKLETLNNYKRNKSSLSKISCEDTLLKIWQERCPKQITDKLITFNLKLTAQAIDNVLNSDNFSHLEKLLLSNHILELHSRELIIPETKKTIRNLCAAKEHGYFFTPEVILKQLISVKHKDFSNISKVFDPAVGGGAILGYAALFLPGIRTVTGIEKDPFTARMAEKILKSTIPSDIEIDIRCMDSTEILFTSEFDDAFDFTVANPPYGRIKLLQDQLTNRETCVELDDTELVSLKSRLKLRAAENSKKYKSILKKFKLDSGTLEYSRVFWAICLKSLSQNGFLSLITPNSWMGDKSGANFRDYLFSNHELIQLYNIKENANFFQTVNQPTVVSHIRKSNQSKEVRIVHGIRSAEDFAKKPNKLLIEDIVQADQSLKRIPYKFVDAFELYKLVSRGKRLGDIPDVMNLRGECDLTLFKDCLLELPAKNSKPLIRGDHIVRWNIQHYSRNDKKGYLNYNRYKKKMGGSEKISHFECFRLVTPQCSYLDKKKRMYWAILEPGGVVSNSANYLITKVNSSELSNTLVGLWLCLNSSLIEWFWSYFNSSNHIGNFEIEELPICEFTSKEISLARKLISQASNPTFKTETVQKSIDSIVFKKFRIQAEIQQYISEALSNSDRKYPSAATPEVPGYNTREILLNA